MFDAHALVHTRHGLASPPNVSAASQCTPGMNQELARFRIGGRPFHMNPVCTEDYDGDWVAVLATGVTQEASDVWVVLHSAIGNELHRVHRAPIGVHLTGGTVVNGLVYLVGSSLATDEMPADADVLVEFAVPHLGGQDPEALDLTPAELSLLGARTRPELQRRLARMAADTDPGSAACEGLARRIITSGARQLSASLPADGSVPLLRAWQVGVYERVAQLHAGLDPADDGLANALSVVHELEATLDCAPGDRCIAVPTPGAAARTEAVVDAQVLFGTESRNTVVAGVIARGHRSDALARPSEDPLTAQRYDFAADRAVAEQLTLDGTIEGRVAGLTRGAIHMVAWGYAVGNRHESAVMLLVAGRAPRRIDDASFQGLSTGVRELAFRDLEHNLEPEVVSVTHLTDNSDSVGVGTILWPPAVVDRSTCVRFDVMRIALGASSLADADRAFRAYSPPQPDHDATCSALEHLAGATSRAIAAAVSGQLVQIDYATPGHPLRGAIRRTPVGELRHAADGSAILGPFAGARCEDLVCDWFQGYCRRTGQEVGYLFLSGRRSTPLWGIARMTGGR